jgi:diacylglycerol kinase (ATP)
MSRCKIEQVLLGEQRVNQMRKKLLFIYNPRSGKGAIRYNLSDIVDIFTKGGYEVIVHPTQAALDASRTITEYADSVDLTVCSGGDGTLDEVVDGLMKVRPHLPIGYIPTGSTNDFGASLGISRDPVRAAKDIVNGKVCPCDVGSFNYKNFVYIAAFGLFTDVAYQTDQTLKNTFGYTAYMIEAGKRLFKIPNYRLKVSADHLNLEDDFVYGMITNSRSVGGMKNLPGSNVDLSDGLFEVRLIFPPKNPKELSDVITTLLNPKMSSPLVLSFKTESLHIESEENVAWTLDGEYGGAYQIVDIHNQKQALHIVLNSEEEAKINV